MPKHNDICPYAIRQWSSFYQWKPGCKASKEDHCDADPKCKLRDKKRRSILDILMGRFK